MILKLFVPTWICDPVTEPPGDPPPPPFGVVRAFPVHPPSQLPHPTATFFQQAAAFVAHGDGHALLVLVALLDAKVAILVFVFFDDVSRPAGEVAERSVS